PPGLTLHRGPEQVHRPHGLQSSHGQPVVPPAFFSGSPFYIPSVYALFFRCCHFASFSTSGLAIFSGSLPLKRSSTRLTASVAILTTHSSVSAAVCGVRITLFISSRGLSSAMGSCSKTSSPAPRITPSFNALIRSCSLTSPPRETLTR